MADILRNALYTRIGIAEGYEDGVEEGNADFLKYFSYSQVRLTSARRSALAVPRQKQLAKHPSVQYMSALRPPFVLQE